MHAKANMHTKLKAKIYISLVLRAPGNFGFQEIKIQQTIKIIDLQKIKML